MTLQKNVILSPDFFGTKDLVVKQKRFFAPIVSGLRMTAFVCHAEFRFNRDQHLMLKWIAGQARNDISQKVILSPDFFGTKDLVVKQKRFFAPIVSGLRMTAFVCHAEFRFNRDRLVSGSNVLIDCVSGTE
jgi:hypothetical protein